MGGDVEAMGPDRRFLMAGRYYCMCSPSTSSIVLTDVSLLFYRPCIRVMVSPTAIRAVPFEILTWHRLSAKTAFGLTEKEMLTIPYESIQASRKTFFSYRDVRDLAIRKFNAGACKNEVESPGQVVSRSGKARIFSKIDHNLKRRTRKNWFDRGEYYPRHIADIFGRKI